MDFVQGTAREQMDLLPQSLDDYITEDNPVRFIDAFVDGLDLEIAGFRRSKPAATGRPPFDPRDLLKLYIYGYLNRVRSSRRLEQETHRNVELMWLLKKLRPDHKTISNFRKDNRNAFKEVFRSFVLLCRNLDLFGSELIAVDGSKFKASNSSHRHFSQRRLRRIVKWIDAKIEAYLQDLDNADKEEPAPADGPSRLELQEKIRKLQDRKDSSSVLLSKMEAQGENEISLTDPDSRQMPHSPKVRVGYNAQIVVDGKHNLIIAHDVINQPNDRDQLSRMSLQAKEALQTDQITVVADAGYYKGEEIKLCEEQNIQAYVPKPATSSSTSRGLFSKDQFSYDADQDIYVCPAGEVLRYHSSGTTVRPGHIVRYYGTKACETCAQRPLCTTNKAGRRSIRRWEHEDVLDRMAYRLLENPNLIRKRKEMVEHPFGTIKFWNDQGHFLVRGLEKVKGEFSLMAIAQNLKRVIRIIGVPKMIAALA